MKRKPLWVAVVVLLSAIGACSVYRSRRAAANRVVIEAALRHFSKYVPLGATREQVKDLLRAERVAFKERCCFEPNGLFSILVRVGQEETPWFCSD
jgi:hypothetical protein